MNKAIDREIEHVLETLRNKDVTDPEYEVGARRLELLCKARSYKNELGISMDTVITAAVSIMEILIILNYERLHVVSSRAFNWIVKIRS